MTSGVTGNVFQSGTSAADVCGSEVDVDILVGAGVIGENIFGFGVAVDSSINANEGNVCVGGLMDGAACVGVAPCVQAVIEIQTINAKINRRFIKQSISGKN